MHRCNHIRIINKLNVAYVVPGFQDMVSNDLHVLIFFHPHFVHDSEELENQIVLSQVITIFEEEFDLFWLFDRFQSIRSFQIMGSVFFKVVVNL